MKKPYALIVSLICALLATPHSGAEQLLSKQGLQPVKNELLPFQSDGCTGWFDGIGKKDYTECCLQHDINYWAGGTSQEKRQTDVELRKCVSEIAGPFMGYLMYVSVRIFGYTDPTDVTRWGYGWKYKRKNCPLNEEEKAEAAAKTPSDLKTGLVKLMTPEQRANTKLQSYQAEPYPTLTGNYCLDEVASALVRSGLVAERIELKYQPDSKSMTYSIKTNLCKYEILARFGVHTLELCTEPVYGVMPTNYLQFLYGFGDCKDIAKSAKIEIDNEKNDQTCN
jgi:hypothetical protein